MTYAVCFVWKLISFIFSNSKTSMDLTVFGSWWQTPQQNTSQLHSLAYQAPVGSPGLRDFHPLFSSFLNSKGRCMAELYTFICIAWVNKAICLNTSDLWVFMIPVRYHENPHRLLLSKKFKKVAHVEVAPRCVLVIQWGLLHVFYLRNLIIYQTKKIHSNNSPFSDYTSH